MIDSEHAILTHNQDVLCVNRYDWAYACDPGRVNKDFRHRYRNCLREARGEGPADRDDQTPWGLEETELFESRRGLYFLALDAADFSSEFVAALIRDCPHDDIPALVGAERIFSRADAMGEDKDFGAYVSKARTEYEFGKRL